jgi:hypothetical protein
MKSAQATAAAKSADPIIVLKALMREDLAGKSDADITALQRSINAELIRLLNALTSPFTGLLEEFLTQMQQVAAVSTVTMDDYSRNPAFYLGQIYAFAEIAETVRHMKVPAEAAAVVLNRSDALAIARLVVERDAITKAELASHLSKPSQNLHLVLQEMERCGLIRRDEIGRSVVYSPTPLTRICLQWAEPEEASQANVPLNTVKVAHR